MFLCFPSVGQAQTFGCTPALANDIVCENSKTGTPSNVWQINGWGDDSIQGFATDISVNRGQTVFFKIKTNASSYRLDIYRMGYYGGNGARKITTVNPSASLPQNQPACLTNGSTHLYDCGNWAVSASWAVPSNATSGIYFAHLVRTDTGGSSHIFFIVRNDSSHSDVLFQTSDTTWQAYSAYGGNSLYGTSSSIWDDSNRAYKVSYNRPFNTFEEITWVFGAEYPMVRWLEANGYDVTYFTDVDSDRNGSLIRNHKVWMSTGHDEYWSKGQRNNVEAARDAGVNLAFFSGNEIFWKTRWENSIDGSGTPYRTLVCYKETLANSKIDPTSAWTGTWRDPRFSPPADGGRPENSLSGTFFMVNGPAGDNNGLSIKVPAADGKMRFWRNTNIANLSSGTATLPQGTLGYEWDVADDNGSRPAGLFHLSTTTQNLSGSYLLDEGGVYGSGTATHHLTLYRAPSGALVFGAGTVQWSWGLDSNHTNSLGFSTPSPSADMRQATVNLFADMGVQPTTIQGGLLLATQSTDATPPVSTITSPSFGASFSVGTNVTMSGTATDSGGVVAGVEVSVNGGQTWHPASGRGSWTYQFRLNQSGTVTLMSRAIDDTGNIESPRPGVQINGPGGASVSGTITPTSLGSGVTVTLNGPSSATATADLWGNYTFSGLASGSYTITPSQSGYAFDPANRAATLNGNDHLTGMDFAASETHSISGTISPAAMGNGATVTLSGAASATTTASASGNYSFSGLTSGSYTVTPSKSGFFFAPANAPVTVNNTNVTGVNFNASAETGNGITVDDAVFGDTAGKATSVTTSPAFSTNAGNELLLALISADVSSAGGTNNTVASVTGGGLTWVLVQRTNTQRGTAEIWRAFATNPLSNVTVTANLALNAYASISVMTFQGANTSGTNGSGAIGATGSGSASSGAPTASLTTTANGSLVLGVGFDWDGATARTLGPNQTMIHQRTVTNIGTFWMQRQSAPTPAAGTLVTINDTAPTNHRYNLAICEIVADSGGSIPTYSISGTISPAASGSGATVTLSGATSATTTADTSGNYSFTGLANGSYTVTPSKTGFTFNPASANVTVSDANATANFTAGAIPTFTISGTISPAASGSGTTVTLSGAASATTAADASGNYSFTGLANGNYTVTPGKTGFTFNPVSVNVTVNDANAAANFTAAAIPTYTISGTIGPAASGSGSTVTLSGAASATTAADASGNYSFTGLANGSYTVTPSKAGFSFAPANAPVTVNSANVTGIDFSATAGPVGETLFTTQTPAITNASDGGGVNYELGMAFTSITAGQITGVRFWKASNETGTHIGRIWSSTGTLLTSVTFTGETALGWQEQLLATPLPITANATYVVSVNTGNTFYVTTDGGLVSQVVNGDLRSVVGNNGVYGGGGAFPTNSWQSSNYFRDVVFVPGGPVATYSISGNISPSASGSGATVTLSGAASATITADASGNYSFTGLANGNYTVTPSKTGFTFNPVSAAVTVSDANAAANFTAAAIPTYTISGTISPAASGSGSTVTLSGAASATTTADASGNYSFTGLANGNYTVTPSKTGFTFTPANAPVTVNSANVTGINFTATANPAGQTLFTTQVPALTNVSDGGGVNYELGTAFSSSVAGQIAAVRFWKASNETGTHTGRIWSSSGALLASVTFANETASGWQQQALAVPLSIAANTTYVVSVNTGSTYYVTTDTGLSSQVANGNLRSVVGNNGRYGSPGAFPTNTWQSSNYFRDVVFVP